MESDFQTYVEECKKYLVDKEKKEPQQLIDTQEAIDLSKKKKKDFLQMKLEEKGDNWFENDKAKQINAYQKSKCRNEIYKFYQTKNFQGLILLIDLVFVDNNLYLRIKDEKELERVIKNISGYEDFSLELTENEKKAIEKRITILKEIAKDPEGYLNNIKERQKEDKNNEN